MVVRWRLSTEASEPCVRAARRVCVTKEALERSAERYGLTVEQYKKRNLMKTEITSRSVGNTVVAVASQAFAKTTGAQIPVDGGNDRII